MCGFAGFLSQGRGIKNSIIQVKNMTQALRHRGPDQFDVWAETDGSLAFGFQRLAVLDLTLAGNQPMYSTSERYVIIFNGEIYNYQELRDELESGCRRLVASGQGPEDGCRMTEGRGRKMEGVVWRGHSDTEVFLAGVEEWGIRRTVEKSVGMFAFALWDRREKVLTLGRDRLGEKPLYYGHQKANGRSVFLFGSELPALRRHPAFEGRINRQALSLYLRYGEVPSPFSIFQGISKLPPGHLLSVSAKNPDSTPEPFWSLRQTVAAGIGQPWAGNFEEAASELKHLLRQSVRGQMVADVPVGAFLSGGTDSSTIVALMQEQSSRPVRTFTVGFREEGYNEADDARRVARHLGTEHGEITVAPQEAREVIPLLPEIYSEPFADSSQIPTFLISRLARQRVTVALSGDGGDELFGGYNRYAFAPRAWQGLRWIPQPIRSGLSRGMKGIPPGTWDSLFRPLERLLPTPVRLNRWGEKIHKGAEVLASPDFGELYHGLVSHWNQPEQLVRGQSGKDGFFIRKFGEMTAGHAVERMMATDGVTYLPDDILTKVDRASMAVSLEVRAPFLDHRVVGFAWRLPLKWKVRASATKVIVRKILEEYVPRSLTERPKMGFGVPISDWLRGPLRDWAEHLLDPVRLAEEGYLEAAPIRERWREHLTGRRNWADALWVVLMFQAWLAKNTDSFAAGRDHQDE